MAGHPASVLARASLDPAQGPGCSIRSPSGLTVGQGFLDPLADHLPFEGGEGCKLVEEQFPGWRRHVDAEVDDVDPDPDKATPLL